MNAESPLLTMRQVAERLAISLSAAYQLVDARKLAHHRIGVGRGAIRVNERDLVQFLADCRREATLEPPAPSPIRSRERIAIQPFKHLRLSGPPVEPLDADSPDAETSEHSER